MSPLIEEHGSTFLCYVKEKAKILQPSDKTVVLLIDEIHLQQFFLLQRWYRCWSC